ncbi:MAG: FMN-binding protein [Treponema sp.]|jgi:major membrane immunogen (membrane-anchored lipoprotein)|nr:FMN-binding protein [Treponema sp.]
MKNVKAGPLAGGIIVLLVCAVFFSGCGGASYRDGTYAGRSGEDDTGAWGEVSVVVSGGRITDCTFVTWQKDGTVKDEDYGKVNGEISNRSFYDKAQLAVRAMEQYAGDLVRAGKPGQIEAVSGATIAWDQFNEAVMKALSAAKK